MTLRLPAAIATALILSACSSGSTEPSDDAFCSSLKDWSDAFTAFGIEMDSLASALSAVEDPADLPSPESLHESAGAILAASSDLEGSMDIVVANTRDPEVAATLQQMNGVVIDLSEWIGTTGRDSIDALEFSITINRDIDRFEEFDNYFETTNSDDVKAYVLETCGNLDDFTIDSDS
jgi:hypothetical protein